MSTSSSSTTSQTDWPRLTARQDPDITLNAEHPAAEVDHIVRGIARQGLRSVPPKTLISPRVDADVRAWFKAQGASYQTRMNAMLRAFKETAGSSGATGAAGPLPAPSKFRLRLSC